MKKCLLLMLLPLLFLGCDTPTDTQSAENDAFRGALKADQFVTGTCEGVCDRQADAGCWCDDVCVGHGDCCADACSLCGHCEPEATVPEQTVEEAAADPFAMALDLNVEHVKFPEGTEAPAYKYAAGTAPLTLGGTEFWQKWSGGENPTFSYSAGTEFGKRCMYASARRFEAMMASETAPPALLQLRAETNWGGSFFNWNDDFSKSDWGDGSGSRLWAWRTGLIKWISQTNKDGSCYLPTLEMVNNLAANCLDKAGYSGGEIQGCSAN